MTALIWILTGGPISQTAWRLRKWWRSRGRCHNCGKRVNMITTQGAIEESPRKTWCSPACWSKKP